MSAPVDWQRSMLEVIRRSADTWLVGERPPSPREESTPLFAQIEAEVHTEWPEVDQDTQPSMAVQPPRRGEPTEVIPVVEEPTVQFRPLSRWDRLKRKLTWQRAIAGSASGLVLLATAWGRFQ